MARSGMRRILLLQPDDGALQCALEALDVDLSVARTVEELEDQLSLADGMIMSAAHLTPALRQQMRDRATDLRWLHLLNAGTDTLIAADFAYHLKVSFSPGAGSTTVAEHGLALMLALARGLPAAMAEQRRRNWNYGLAQGLSSLRGRSVLIFGFGHIGKALAGLLQAFGMRITAVTRSGSTHPLASRSLRMEDAQSVLGEFDFLVIAAPLTAETRRFFDADTLEYLKPGAFLVNLSRGGIVDLDALGPALVSGQLGGAALDVVDPEPLPEDHPIWSAPNLLITPHTAAAGANAGDRQQLIELAVENTRRFSQDENLLHVVTFASR